MEFNRKIGYIGTGSLGGAIAQYLVKKGFDLTAYDVRPEALNPFEKKAASLKELMDNTDFIMICVENDYHLNKLVFGKDGIIDYAREGQMLVIQTVCKMTTVQEIAKILKFRGVSVVDATVAGSLKDRENGTMGVYVGGSKANVEKCMPVFAALGANGEKVMHLGQLGYGVLGGMINSILTVAQEVPTLEAAKLARACSMPEESLVKACSIGTADNFMVRNWSNFDELMKAHRYGPGMCRNNHSDIAAADAAALAKGVSLRMCVSMAELSEKVYYERAKYLSERDGYKFPTNIPMTIDSMKDVNFTSTVLG